MKEEKIEELLSVCKTHQGEYVPGDHGPGSWATTYSWDFINAATDIFLILSKEKSLFAAQLEMSKLFKTYGIRSCRGSEMTFARVEYLYKAHLKKRVAERINVR